MAEEVLMRCGYEQIIFVPARVPPHKNRTPAATPEQRLEMLTLSLSGRTRFVADSFEIERDAVSFTVKTLQHLIDSGSVTGRPGLIIGADLIAGFQDWRDVETIGEMSDLILVKRPGFDTYGFDRPHTAIENYRLDISSTEIRNRINQGLPYRYLVHPSVYEYIEKHGLYR
jgi:nicotinate-nucleotide adenylyltransferase